MDSISNILPAISQLISAVRPRDNDQHSKADMEQLVRSVVNDCLQKQAATEQRDFVNSLMEIVKESIARPVETRREPDVEDLLKTFRKMNVENKMQQSGTDESQKNKQMVMEVLQQLMNDQKTGQNDTRSRTRERSVSSNFVLPWCDDPNTDSQPKFSGKGKQFSENRAPGNDMQDKYFNKNKGLREKKGFDDQQMKNAYQGRGGFRGGNRGNFSQDRSRKDNFGRGGGAAGPTNEFAQARSHSQTTYQRFPSAPGANQPFNTQHQHQNWQQEGAVGYNTPYQGPTNHHTYQQPFVTPVNTNYGPGPGSHPSFPRQQFGYANAHRNAYPSVVPPLLNPPSQNNHLNNFSQPPPPVFIKPVDAGQGYQFRGRGGYQRGGYQRGGYQRGGYNNSRPVSRGDRSDNVHRNSSDLLAGLSFEEVTTIKNALKSDSDAMQSKGKKNKTQFKPKKSNMPGKQNEKENDEDEVQNLVKNENKVLEDNQCATAQSTGAKKKKKTFQNNEAETEKSASSEKMKLLFGLGINKDALANVDSNQEIKHVVLIARSGNETKTFQPKTIGQFKDFMSKYPNAEGIVVKKE
ncbi:uncharacterized protein LOC134533990 isoform X2 [Bacillus rossius redtenbacheri]|uniref:uncharacterized protein LOC134533990 isoform X2 n=1 Tax=Bacillus rossius redtenbacheri TaxID=93214 RepID=UPI002FDE2571